MTALDDYDYRCDLDDDVRAETRDDYWQTDDMHAADEAASEKWADLRFAQAGEM